MTIAILASFSQTVLADTKPVDEKKEDKKEEKKDTHFYLKGGDLYTVTGPVLKNTDLLIKNGKIMRIGSANELPDGCEVLDVTGYRVYPGLVAVGSSMIIGYGSGSPENTTNMYGMYMTLGLAGGLTTAVTGNSVAKLSYGSLEGMLVKTNLFYMLKYSRRSPSSRSALRADLDKVRKYLRELDEYNVKKSSGQKDLKEPDKSWLKGKYDQYLKLIKGEMTARIRARSAQDIRDVCNLASRYGLKVVIEGAMEGWTIPGELGRAGVQAILTPRDKSYASKKVNRPTGSSIENAKILHDHGVNFAIITRGKSISLGGITGRDLMTLPMEAAFAVRGGLPEKDAIESITIDAARILGLDKRIGSIETGKDADLIVCDGDLLHYNTMVQWTLVDGKVVYDKEKEPLLAHIRPRDKSKEKVKSFWPRPFDVMPDFGMKEKEKKTKDGKADKKDEESDKKEAEADKEESKVRKKLEALGYIK